MFKIMAERCNECLYGTNKIVSDSRRKEIIRKLDKTDDYFICHKATIAHQKVACRGDWEQRDCGKAGRMATVFNMVEFVPETELQQKERKNGKRKNKRSGKSQ